MLCNYSLSLSERNGVCENEGESLTETVTNPHRSRSLSLSLSARPLLSRGHLAVQGR